MSWRRSFNLNGWLRDRGYLAVSDRSGAPAEGALHQIDWTRTRAYGLGLNGLYVNLRGRERHGIVALEDRERLVAEIRRALLETADPKTGRAAITQVFVTGSPGRSAGPQDTAPDLVVGYAEGTRVSNESALGGVPAGVLQDNTGEWSGDHCMDPAAVPGILLTSRRLRQTPASLDRVAAAILAEFGDFKIPSAATRRTTRARER
jgi:predicted AlkP superfamily phosphohydrolase/phosphomutase